jgi:hypothetical protein
MPSCAFCPARSFILLGWRNMRHPSYYDKSKSFLHYLCDPPLTIDDNPNNDYLGIPIYAMADGWIYIDSARGTLILIIDDYTIRNDSDTNIPIRREIVYTHITNLQVVQFDTVSKGTLLGYLCRHQYRTQCGISINADDTDISFTINHLAIQIRFWSHKGTKSTEPSNPSAPRYYEEILGVLAIPRCIYDDWNENHLNESPKAHNTQGWPYNGWYAACPATFG